MEIVSIEKDLRGDEGTVRLLFAARWGALRPLPPARKDELDGRGGRVTRNSASASGHCRPTVTGGCCRRPDQPQDLLPDGGRGGVRGSHEPGNDGGRVRWK